MTRQFDESPTNRQHGTYWGATYWGATSPSFLMASIMAFVVYENESVRRPQDRQATEADTPP
jgi:hypothetical protein